MQHSPVNTHTHTHTHPYKPTNEILSKENIQKKTLKTYTQARSWLQAEVLKRFWQRETSEKVNQPTKHKPTNKKKEERSNHQPSNLTIQPQYSRKQILLLLLLLFVSKTFQPLKWKNSIYVYMYVCVFLCLLICCL